MTDLAARPEIPLQVITPADVRASIRRATRSLEKAAEEIVWQVEMEAWRTLGYSSWNAMREAEYGDAAFMVPKKDRPELVGRMRSAGLTQQEIADTAGVSSSQVNRDLKSQMGNESPAPITNSRGQERPATYAKRETPAVPFESVEQANRDLAAGKTVTYRSGDQVNTTTGEINPDEKTDPAPAEPVIATTCPTCHGTGKVTR